MKKKKAFTLAEVLVSLTIIGVIAALTIPAVVLNSQRKANAAALKRAINTLDEAIDTSRLESKYQPVPKCFYWDQKPSSMCNAVTHVNPDTGEKSWTCPDGSPLPGNYNGEFSQCAELLLYLKDNMQTTKTCTSGVAEGCMPEYKGNDKVYKESNPGKSDLEAVTATSGCGGWRSSLMKTKYSWVTTDGLIFFPYDKNWPGAAIIAVDVNGKKGPNKWGYDVFALTLNGNYERMNGYTPGGCDFYEKGGKSASQLLMGNE